MASNIDLNSLINQLSKERGVSRGQIIQAFESAMLSAAKKHFGPHLNLEVHFNPETGDFDIVKFRTVVDKVYDPEIQISLEEARAKYDANAEVGDEIGEKLDKKLLGRIAAQTAKQVITQKVADAVRDSILEDFRGEKGQIVVGTVQRIEENGTLYVLVGRAEGIIPKKEQIPRERFQVGDKVRALLLNIDRSGKEGFLILSRSHPDFVVKLFEIEVPELKEGLVRVVKVARKPGEKTKILVASNDPSIDPEGCMIGLKRSRVNSVSQELNGERIDVIGYTDDQPTLVAKALRPAKPVRILVDEDNKVMEVVVPDSYLAVAIGNRGTNVSLASQLTGWTINLVASSVAEESARVARKTLEQIPGIAFTEAEILFQAGFRTLEDVATASQEELVEIGIEPERASLLISNANVLFKEVGEVAQQKMITDLTKLDLPKETIQTLIENGITKIQDLSLTHTNTLMTIFGNNEAIVNQINETLRAFLKSGYRHLSER
ncbi:MAG: transcription termination factor NusA [Deltaproteobacteria bacterium]|nr:transcription termination factor NusA [Deltaproteobacteria bacterium]MCX7953327.1 transcription termination factor NusA [Deltaproteobacteria bacterium]